MDNLSNFSEALGELMFEHNLNATQLAKNVGISLPTISNYLNCKFTPNVENLLKIADYFDCSCDFLLGKATEPHSETYVAAPPFCERLKTLKDYFGCPWQAFYQKAKISASRFYEWKNGKRKPTLDNIIALAKGFKCSVDFILGRVKD